jgi:hypothetical protein
MCDIHHGTTIEALEAISLAFALSFCPVSGHHPYLQGALGEVLPRMA